MKIFSYDICEGDKGIIFANNKEEAIRLFKEQYPDIEVVDCYDDFHTCVITEVGTFSGEPKVMFLYD